MATTQVLPAKQHDGQLFHQPGSRTPSPGASSIYLAGSTPPLSSSPKPISLHTSGEHHERITSPPPSSTSADSSPRTSRDDLSSLPSLQSTPISGFSMDDAFDVGDDDIEFPNYDDQQFSSHPSEYMSTQKSSEDDTDVPEISTTTDTTDDDSLIPTPSVADDTAIKQEPSRHVDYLSHDWREEDIWASWRHIVNQRNVYGQKSRLENASWRTWAKSKFQLSTVPPERLNWLKESDVTWLYGPLKPAESHPITSDTSTPPSQISKSSSFVNKKPILKKRSVSEAMLQKSLSNSSLLKQAAASVQAQQARPPRRGLNSVNSDMACSSGTSSRPPSRDETDYFSRRASNATDEAPAEGKEEKHIRFDEVVEQCVAVECKDPRYDDDADNEDDPSNSVLSESSSDEGLLMMKRRSRQSDSKRDGSGRLSRSNSMSASMIETIPATTLKYRNDSPDVTEEQPRQHVFSPGSGWGAARPSTPGSSSSSKNSGGRILSPSPSSETLRPSRPSRNFLLPQDDDDDDNTPQESSQRQRTSSSSDDLQWSFGASNPNSSLGASVGPSDYDPTDGYDNVEGMRRTASGMLMPIDEDEDDLVAAGWFGRANQMVNRGKDIGWMLWNSFSSNSPPRE